MAEYYFKANSEARQPHLGLESTFVTVQPFLEDLKTKRQHTYKYKSCKLDYGTL